MLLYEVVFHIKQPFIPDPITHTQNSDMKFQALQNIPLLSL